MSRQSEQVLEDQLIAQLETLGYSKVLIRNEEELLANLQAQLEKHNNTTFSKLEFERIVNILNKGSIFEKAKTLRTKQHIQRDNGDDCYFEFLNTEHWCQNQYQVTHQVTIEGKYKNRYDVTILVNGLPLVQIELKRRGLEMKEAFNQICRYQRHSFGARSALFQYVQLFIISNGVNTKYFANNPVPSLEFKQTFYWTDKNNKRETNILNGFGDAFLEPCHLSKMICKYIVLNETHRILMVLRPYQFYAVEAMIDRVRNSNKNGYVWHTTGSGKTLTSFKASQIIMNLPEVKKVIFVVDRKDLDYQTTKEFNSFKEGSIDGTENTRSLVKQFGDDTKLIVTTIQKLNTAISKARYQKAMEPLQDERLVFIFDECHRSQFGETHERIKRYFTNNQMFGFTGTPIFADNAVKNDLGKRTTRELFGDCLHKYVITDAIRDQNVLKFAVEYVGRYKEKESRTNIDIEVEDIDRKELMDSPLRLEKIVDYIIAHFDRKTHRREFTAMMCVSGVQNLITYYDLLRKKFEAGEHSLRVATIFSYTANEDDADAQGYISEELSVVEEPRALFGMHEHTREKLDAYIVHFNEMYGTKHSTKDSQAFYNYYKDVSKKVKEKKVDLLLVVNMFLTGFDSKGLNTLFVDKNLRYHGLIQAYSRTNRIIGERKSQGNIVVFRNLKKATDEAITLFSNKEAVDVIIMEPYENYVEKFNEAFDKLVSLVPTVASVDELVSEDEEVAFVQAFRALVRLKNTINSFADFDWEDLDMDEQLFEDYKSKYLDLHYKVRHDNQKEKVSILDDVDFELELIHRDEVNVGYILKLLAALKDAKAAERAKKEKEIMDHLAGEVQLRSKRDLIQKFIEKNLPNIQESDDIPEAFDNFWNEEKKLALDQLVEDEKLSSEKTQALIEHYLFAERAPINDDVIALLEGPAPSLLQRRTLGKRILERIMEFVETFIEGVDG